MCAFKLFGARRPPCSLRRLRRHLRRHHRSRAIGRTARAGEPGSDAATGLLGNPEPGARLRRAWAALGFVVGQQVGESVCILTGIAPAVADEDRLKALGATAASSGGVARFHVTGVTPEAVAADAAWPAKGVRRVEITPTLLRAARDELTTATIGDHLDAVSIGTPHLSLSEFAKLAEVLDDGEPFHPSCTVWISTSRDVLATAHAAGFAQVCEASGAKIVVDTCTYLVPILAETVRTAMTTSGKWAWYAPANMGINVVFGSLAECIASAGAGRVIRNESAGRDAAARPVPALTAPALTAPALTLCAGDGLGDILWLDEPLSFWGGTDLASGLITDVHHPQHGVSLAGRVVVMCASRGSSSSSSVLAEQLRAGVGPVAIVLSSRDLIVTLGALAAAEVYGIRMPILLLDSAGLALLPRSGPVTVSATDAAASVNWSAPITL